MSTRTQGTSQSATMIRGSICGKFTPSASASSKIMVSLFAVGAPKVLVSFRFQALQRFVMSPLLWYAQMDLTESLHVARPPMITFIRLRR